MKYNRLLLADIKGKYTKIIYKNVPVLRTTIDSFYDLELEENGFTGLNDVFAIVKINKSFNVKSLQDIGNILLENDIYFPFTNNEVVKIVDMYNYNQLINADLELINADNI